MTIIYRVELKFSPIRYIGLGKYKKQQNIGPYCHPHNYLGGTEYQWRLLSTYALDRPGPELDKKIGRFFNPGKHIFGFISIEQLKDWFKYDMEILHDAGFYVAVYDVREHCYTSSRLQACFDVRCSKLVDFLSMYEI